LQGFRYGLQKSINRLFSVGFRGSDIHISSKSLLSLKISYCLPDKNNYWGYQIDEWFDGLIWLIIGGI
ncbi:MAG: hypothetical protein ABSA06_09720, partial [Geobacteraceae bacterium]